MRSTDITGTEASRFFFLLYFEIPRTSACFACRTNRLRFVLYFYRARRGRRAGICHARRPLNFPLPRPQFCWPLASPVPVPTPRESLNRLPRLSLSSSTSNPSTFLPTLPRRAGVYMYHLISAEKGTKEKAYKSPATQPAPITRLCPSFVVARYPGARSRQTAGPHHRTAGVVGGWQGQIDVACSPRQTSILSSSGGGSPHPSSPSPSIWTSRVRSITWVALPPVWCSRVLQGVKAADGCGYRGAQGTGGSSRVRSALCV